MHNYIIFTDEKSQYQKYSNLIIWLPHKFLCMNIHKLLFVPICCLSGLRWDKVLPCYGGIKQKLVVHISTIIRLKLLCQQVHNSLVQKASVCSHSLTNTKCKFRAYQMHLILAAEVNVCLLYGVWIQSFYVECIFCQVLVCLSTG